MNVVYTSSCLVVADFLPGYYMSWKQNEGNFGQNVWKNNIPQHRQIIKNEKTIITCVKFQGRMSLTREN